MSLKVVVLDDLSEEGLSLLKAAEGIQFEIRTGLKGEALRQTLSEFDGAICRSGVKITAESLANNRRLKAIVRAGVGTDNIDKAAATRLGIIVMNTPSGNTVSTAEHTMALMLGLARNTAPAHASLKEGLWDRKKFSGVELRGKTLGIVGLGRIGQSVAQKANAFEMIVIGFDPFLPKEKAAELNIEMHDQVDSLLAKVDFLTVHTPLTPETQGLVNRERLQHMKKGVRLINCARGGIYDEAALVEGLQNGRIAGVALDVFEEEPCVDSPLFQMPGVLCSPHLGASTDEAQRLVALEAVELLVNYLTTGAIRHAVNALALDVPTLQRMKTPASLAYRLGKLMHGLHGGAITRCELDIEGELAGEDARILSAAFCVGLLEDIMEDVNLVNAELMFRERGIELIRRSSPVQNSFSSLISATVSGDGKSSSASGTIIGKNMLRLVRLENFHLETYLDGHLLVFTHRDIPGIIGYVGQVLSKSNVNIAQMVVGRLQNSPGGEAIGVLNLDSRSPQAAHDEILKHPDITSVRVIDLPKQGFRPDFLG